MALSRKASESMNRKETVTGQNLEMALAPSAQEATGTESRLRAEVQWAFPQANCHEASKTKRQGKMGHHVGAQTGQARRRLGCGR